MGWAAAQGDSAGTLGSTVEVSELESLSNGDVIVGDGSGAPTTLHAFSSSAGTTFIIGADVFLTRKAAATLHLGEADAASPVAQVLGAQGSRGGTDTDVAGASLTVRSGIGTGAGAASSLVFQTPTVGASGTTAQTMATRLTIATAALTATVPLNGPAGSATAPSFTLTDVNTGFYRSGANGIGVSLNGNAFFSFAEAEASLRMRSDIFPCWSSTTSPAGTLDSGIARSSAGVLEVNSATRGTFRDLILRAARQRGAFGQEAVVQHATTELLAFTGATMTATNLIPAGSVVLGVTIRVTTTITGASSMEIGDGTDADRWGTSIALTAGTTTTGSAFTITTVPFYAAATSVVFTANVSNFTAGAVRITVHFVSFVAATS